MIDIKLNLSEETRGSTIIINGQCFDSHITEGLYIICNHGTYEVVSCMTKEFYQLMNED